MLTIAYYRVSTADQTVDNQALELETAGYKPDMVFSETISGKVPAADRPEFGRMLHAINSTVAPKRLVVTKLDRLGRNAADMLTTVQILAAFSCKVTVLQFDGLDLASTAGKLVLGVLSAVAEVERDMLVERTHAGLARAKANGVQLGRRHVLDPVACEEVRAGIENRETISELARRHGVSRGTIQRVSKGTYRGATA